MPKLVPKKKSRPTKKEWRQMEIHAELNGRWDQGSAEEIINLVIELIGDQLDGDNLIQGSRKGTQRGGVEGHIQ